MMNTSVLSQNLIFDPGFEADLDNCYLQLFFGRTVYGSIRLYDKWRTAYGWTTPDGGSPDLFDTRNWNVFRHVYGCHFSLGSDLFQDEPFNIIPFKGHGMGGFSSYGELKCNCTNIKHGREYFQSRLIEDLEEGAHYCFSIHVSAPEKPLYFASGFGLLAIDSAYHDGDFWTYDPFENPHETTPDVEFGYLDTRAPEWKELKAEFVARSNASHILIGNFMHRDSVEIVNHIENKYATPQHEQINTYYLIDEVSLVKIDENLSLSLKDTIVCPNVPFLIDPEGFDSYRYVSSLNLQDTMYTEDVLSISTNRPQDIYVTAKYCHNYTYTDTFHIDVFQYKDRIIQDDTTLCPSDVLKVDLPSSAISAQWNDGSTQLSRTLNKEFVYEVEIVDSNSCKRYDLLDLKFEKWPYIYYPYDTVQLCEDYEVKIENYYGNLYWSNGAFGDRYEIEEEGDYSVVSLNQCGRGSISFYAEKLENIVVPNIITPNNDGKNECLYIRNLENLSNSFEIFSRWGESIYKVENYKNDWCPSELNDGTYYYFLQVEGCPDNKGFIYLIK